jgi:hypothetical protein
MTYTWNITGAGNTITASTTTDTYTTSLTTANTDPYTPYTCTVFVTNANGCTSTVSEAVTVTVYAVPAVHTVSSATVCYGTAATLTADVSGITTPTYMWDINGVTTPANTNTYTTSALTATTTYTVQITNDDTGCKSNISAAGTITVNPLPVPAFVSPSTAVCANSEIIFTAVGAGDGGSYCFTYQCPECLRNPFLTGQDVPPAAHCLWDSDCKFGPNTYSMVMSDSGTMTVWVQAKNQNGCTDSISTSMVVSPPVYASISPAATTAEAGANVTLTASPAGADAYLWTTAESTESITVPSSVEAGASTDYSVTVTVAGCSGTATATVTTSPCTPGIVGSTADSGDTAPGCTGVVPGEIGGDPALACPGLEAGQIGRDPALSCPGSEAGQIGKN